MHNTQEIQNEKNQQCPCPYEFYSLFEGMSITQLTKYLKEKNI